ncbi:hypothetical protein KIPB_009452, partial [Kipferlia bialata]
YMPPTPATVSPFKGQAGEDVPLLGAGYGLASAWSEAQIVRMVQWSSQSKKALLNDLSKVLRADYIRDEYLIVMCYPEVMPLVRVTQQIPTDISHLNAEEVDLKQNRVRVCVPKVEEQEAVLLDHPLPPFYNRRIKQYEASKLKAVKIKPPGKSLTIPLTRLMRLVLPPSQPVLKMIVSDHFHRHPVGIWTVKPESPLAAYLEHPRVVDTFVHPAPSMSLSALSASMPKTSRPARKRKTIVNLASPEVKPKPLKIRGTRGPKAYSMRKKLVAGDRITMEGPVMERFLLHYDAVQRNIGRTWQPLPTGTTLPPLALLRNPVRLFEPHKAKVSRRGRPRSEVSVTSVDGPTPKRKPIADHLLGPRVTPLPTPFPLTPFASPAHNTPVLLSTLLEVWLFSRRFGSLLKIDKFSLTDLAQALEYSPSGPVTALVPSSVNKAEAQFLYNGAEAQFLYNG